MGFFDCSFSEMTDSQRAYLIQLKCELDAIKNAFYVELPDKFTWHDDVVPYRYMHVITVDDEIVEGCFHAQHGVFYIKENKKNRRMIPFSRIAYIDATEWRPEN